MTDNDNIRFKFIFSESNNKYKIGDLATLKREKYYGLIDASWVDIIGHKFYEDNLLYYNKSQPILNYDTPRFQEDKFGLVVSNAYTIYNYHEEYETYGMTYFYVGMFQNVLFENSTLVIDVDIDD